MKYRSPTIEAAKAETRKGHCIACDEPIPPPIRGGRPRIICSSDDCARYYHPIYAIDRHAGKLEKITDEQRKIYEATMRLKRREDRRRRRLLREGKPSDRVARSAVLLPGDAVTAGASQ